MSRDLRDRREKHWPFGEQEAWTLFPTAKPRMWLDLPDLQEEQRTEKGIGADQYLDLVSMTENLCREGGESGL